MKKTLIIGIGGTGLTAIREIRRLIVERYEQGLQASEVSAVKFLYIDTDINDITRHNWSVLGKNISLTPAEKIIITGDRLGPLVQNSVNYPDIDAWLPTISNYIGEPGNGAKGIRAYGRLIYEFSENKQRVQQACTNCYDALNHSHRELTDWRFYLICGLSGGTGSGMFLPFSWDLENWHLYQKGNNQNKFYGFFVIPPLAITGRHERYHSNAYAALKELNYYPFAPEKVPYNNCYLLEPRNSDGTVIDLASLPLLIAQRLFLNIQGGEAADRVDAIMDNPSLGNLKRDPVTGDQHASYFSTFGISTVSYPREAIYKCLAYKLATIVVFSWTAETNYPKNINERVKTELDSIRLSLSHLLGDSDPFGNKSYFNYEVEINNQIDRELSGIAARKLGDNTEIIRTNIEEKFRGIGIVNFYQQLDKDAKGAVEVAVNLTREKITSYLINPDFGIEYTEKFISELKLIIDEFKARLGEQSNDRYEQRVTRSRQNLAKVLDAVKKREVGLLYLTFQQDRKEISDKLKDYLITLAGLKANKYALNFLGKIIPEIDKIQEDLGTWKNLAEQLLNKLNGILKDLLEQLSKGTQENGKVIFNEIGLEELTNQVNNQTIKSEIENRIRINLGQQDLDLTQIIKQHNLERFLYQTAYDWVCSETFPANVSKFTLYDKFINQYPNSEERQQILNDVKRLSTSFLKFAPSEVQLDTQIVPTSVEIISVPNLDKNQGQIGHEGRPNHLVVIDDIKSVGVYQTYNANDGNRITFLQEKKAFPLRFIECLSTLKQRYESYPHQQALHIDKKVVPNLYNLYLLTQQQQQQIQNAEEVFVLARAFGWISFIKNQQTNRNEIRYEFEQDGLIGIQSYVLGYQWDEVFTLFINDSIANHPINEQVRTARELLTDKFMKKCQDARLNYEVLQQIENQLKICVGERFQEYGRDSSVYQKYQKIANRVVIYLRKEF